ncbi:toxin-antitoxin system YwqK family antitoxin [Flavobacteriaceae bacterium]|nr:toxin-antitoxin system YwqK family antitoxin [Flavobacteriaceae bacterium]
MKYLYTVFIVLVLAACNTANPKDIFSENEIQKSILINIDSLSRDSRTGWLKYDNQYFTGVALKFYPNGNVQYQKSIENGIMNGFYISKFRNGQVNVQAKYKKGMRIGWSNVWFPNGQLKNKAFYKKGVVHGADSSWYVNGNLFKVRNLTGGVETGMQKAWRKNGKLFANYEAKHGRIFGLRNSSMCNKLENETVKK